MNEGSGLRGSFASGSYTESAPTWTLGERCFLQNTAHLACVTAPDGAPWGLRPQTPNRARSVAELPRRARPLGSFAPAGGLPGGAEKKRVTSRLTPVT
jgi:hypothetical protein